MSAKEYADLRYRSTAKPGWADRKKFSGIAVVPLAREWLIAKMERALGVARTGKTERERNRAAAEARTLHSQMSRLGMFPKEGRGK